MEKKTKSIATIKYNYILSPDHEEEEVDSQGHPDHYSEFDPDGRLIREISYNAAGEFEEMFEYRYNELGHLIHESYYPVESEVAEVKTYVRNESGLLLKALKHYQDGSADTTTYEYNGEGRLTRLVTTDPEGDVEQVESLEWENGEVVGHHIVDGQGEPVEQPDYSNIKPGESRAVRNEKGQLVTEEELDENGVVYMTVNRTYHDDGRADEVDVFIDGRGRTVTRHYFLKYEYTFFD